MNINAYIISASIHYRNSQSAWIFTTSKGVICKSIALGIANIYDMMGGGEWHSLVEVLSNLKLHFNLLHMGFITKK